MYTVIAKNVIGNDIGLIATYCAPKACQLGVRSIGITQTCPCPYCFPVKLDIEVYMDDTRVELPIRGLAVGTILRVFNMTSKHGVFSICIDAGIIPVEAQEDCDRVYNAVKDMTDDEALEHIYGEESERE